jgi:acetyl esterase/lipase
VARRAPLALLLCGCGAVAWLGIALFYDEAELPGAQQHLGIVYREATGTQLDLFVPAREPGWPVVLYAYGGGWKSGQRDYVIGGADVYRNIGRRLASLGVGVALIDYRLQPEVTWREQIDDVAAAAGWLHANVVRYGGDPEALFFAGHSAGAQLVTYAALERRRLESYGVAATAVRGIAPISGSGFDLTDPETASPAYFRERFGTGPDWQNEASALRLVSAESPPLCAFVAEDDPPNLHVQAARLRERFASSGVPAELFEIPDVDHYTIVVAASQDGGLLPRRLVEFVGETLAARN